MASSVSVGRLPDVGVTDQMDAQAIRTERLGDPKDALALRNCPRPGPVRAREVLVAVMGAGINSNNVWVARGVPINVIAEHGAGGPYDFRIGGCDASGIVWALEPGVTDHQFGDRVIAHPGYWDPADPQVTRGADPMLAVSARIWGYILPAAHQHALAGDGLEILRPPPAVRLRPIVRPHSYLSALNHGREESRTTGTRRVARPRAWKDTAGAGRTGAGSRRVDPGGSFGLTARLACWQAAWRQSDDQQEAGVNPARSRHCDRRRQTPRSRASDPESQILPVTSFLWGVVTPKGVVMPSADRSANSGPGGARASKLERSCTIRVRTCRT